MQRRHHQVGSINQRLIKLKQGQKTAFPFPLMVSPWLCKRQANNSSLNHYSLPFFIPLHFSCRRRPNPVHLFALFSIAMFTSLSFTPFFYLLFVLFGSAVGIGYIIRLSPINKSSRQHMPSARDITFKLFCVNFLCHIESRPCFGPACVKCGVGKDLSHFLGCNPVIFRIFQMIAE